MKILSKVTFHSVFLVWKMISKVAEIVYSFVVAVDRWISERGIDG